MKSILFISWDLYPSNTGSASILNQINNLKTTHKLYFLGEKKISQKGNIDRPNHFYLTNFFSSIPRFGKYLKWLFFVVDLFLMNRVVKKVKPNIIIGVFPDGYFLILSFFVSIVNGIQFKPWFHNTYSFNKPKYSLAYFFEYLVFKNSEEIIFLSEGLKSFYSNHYQGVFSVLKHLNIIDKPTVKQTNNNVKNSKLNIILNGTLNDSCLNAVKYVVNEFSEDKFQFNVFGDNAKNFEHHSISHLNLNFQGFLKYDEYYQKLIQNDFAIVPLGLTGNFSDHEYQTIFPTRTIILLQLGIPILFICPNDSFLNDFVLENNCGVVVNNYSEIYKKIDNLISRKEYYSKQSIKTGLLFNKFSFVENFELIINHNNE